MDTELYKKVRKRMLMFYFAAGANLLMGMWVFSAGGAVAAGTRMTIVLIFLVFAALNYYMARKLGRQWAAHVRQQGAGTAGPDEAATK